MVVVLLTPCEPIAVPPVAHVPALGPQREKDTVPLQIKAPPTVTVAESVAETDPAPMERPPAGIGLPLPSFAVVTIEEEQVPKLPSTKLLSTALVEVDERLSARVLAKHSCARPGNSERLMPPS